MPKKTVLPAPVATFSPRGFRIANAAVYMGTTPWFVEELIRERKIPAFKLGRAYVILKEDMDAYLDTAREEAA